jgi:ATP-dependent helicase/nuclease subunit B
LLCTYRYYLKHHLGLHAVDTTAEEMSPPAFGDLLHRVLQEFAASPVAESDRATAIRDQLYSTLDAYVLQSYGDTPLPAVRVQVEQARLRLDRFAQWQADWRREGWRIEHAEVDVNGERAWLDVDGEPMYLRGRIDRIDIHETTQEWLVLDYKTGESGRTPEAAHRQRQSDWTDLQLPLYRHLVKGLGLSDALQLGYLMLPKALSDIGVSRAAWSPDELAQADAVAADIVRRVRAEAFWPPARLTGAHDEFAVLCQASRHPTLDTAALAKERATR